MSNKSPTGIQTWIHFMEEGAGRDWLRRFLLAVCAVAVVVVYHLIEARNFMAPEAMDQAQLGRNLAEHRGYTTWNIRPLSVHLLQEKARSVGKDPNGLLKSLHPDLENPPVYPALLAVMFKVLPVQFSWGAAAEPAFLHRLPPEMAISWLNLALFFVVVAQVYRLGLLLFDPTVALLAATVTFGTELLWRFVYSGLPTILLLVMVLFLVRVLVAWERSQPATPGAPSRRRLFLALLAGLTLGVMFLTRYSTGLLVLPVLAFLAWQGGKFRWSSVAVALTVFTLTAAPWLVRNWHLCGQPFGTAGYALFAGTESFPEDKLVRSFDPKLAEVHLNQTVTKLFSNALELLENDLPRFGGNWLAAFFLVGLLMPFQNPILRRLRWFLIGALVLLFLAQAAARSHLTTLTPLVNSENLLVLVAPLIFLFGAAFFQLILDRIEFPFPLVRTAAHTFALLLFSLPMVLVLGSDMLAIPQLVPRRQYPIITPNYLPSVILELAGYTPEGSLLISDVPWAVAWYGGRACVALPLRVKDGNKEDFFAVNDYQMKVQAIYLSPLTANSPWHKSFFEPNQDHAWFKFGLDLAFRGRLPDDFPLKAVPRGYLEYGHFFFAAQPWWVRPAGK
jgi:hypothetical protein